MATTTKAGEIFGAHLRELRLSRGFTQPQLAERCESNVPFISNVERGVMLPGLAMLLRFADALDCSVCDLVAVFDANRRKRQHKGSASSRNRE